MKKKNVCIVLNPCSGLQKAKKSIDEILKVFVDAGCKVKLVSTQCQGDGIRLAKENINACDYMVCIGGDGTFSEVMSGILQSGVKKPIAYIPAGSTNDFASSLGLSKDYIKAAQDIVDGEVRTVDVGLFNDRYFSYVASFGAFSKASYSAPQKVKKHIGHLAYVLEGIKEIKNFHGEELIIKLDDEEIRGEYLLGAVSNSTSVAGIIKLDPDMLSLNDGIFELLLVKQPRNFIEFMSLVKCFASGKFKGKMFSIKKSSKVEMQCSKDMNWSLDGEYQEGVEKVLIQNIHQGLDIILNR